LFLPRSRRNKGRGRVSPRRSVRMLLSALPRGLRLLAKMSAAVGARLWSLMTLSSTRA